MVGGGVVLLIAAVGAAAAWGRWLVADIDRLAMSCQRGAARLARSTAARRMIDRRCGRVAAGAYRAVGAVAASRIGLVAWRRAARRRVGPGLVALAIVGSVPIRRARHA